MCWWWQSQVDAGVYWLHFYTDYGDLTDPDTWAWIAYWSGYVLEKLAQLAAGGCL